MAKISQITLPNEDVYDIRASAIPFAQVDSTSTATKYTATVPGVAELTDGVCIMLQNGVVTSASGFTININSLGAKPVYSNMATGNEITPTAPTRDTTIFNINYTMLFVYSSDIVTGGGWICYRGYDANTVADVTVGGTSVVNAGNVAVVPAIPTKVSDLTNDSGFITSYTETDPTVPSWAKAATKPTYTASEVGALPDTTEIPSVSVNRKITSGTNIADITINGTTTQLYAPTSGGGGDVNVIETIRVNGTPLVPDGNKAVDISVPSVVEVLESSKTVALLIISSGQAAVYNGSNPMTFIQFYNAYQTVEDIACLHMLSQTHGYVYEPVEVDAGTATIKLQSIYDNIVHAITVTDSGSGLVGTYTETAIPSAVATATPTTNTISGVSSSSITTVQYGCVVSVDVSITLTAAVTNQTQLCASLPKPLTAVRTVADQFETTYKRPLRFILGTSGMLDIRLGEAGTYYHHFTYITNEGITTLTDADLTSF